MTTECVIQRLPLCNQLMYVCTKTVCMHPCVALLCSSDLPFEQNQEVSGAQTLREQKWDVSAGGRRSEQGLCKRPVQSKSCLCKSRRCLCKSKGVCAKASFRVQITCEATAVRPCGCCRTTFGQENDINIFSITDFSISSPTLI